MRSSRGAVAQLGERCIRIAEVRGSSPLSSICYVNWLARCLRFTRQQFDILPAAVR